MPDLRDSLQVLLGDEFRITRELAEGGLARVFVADHPASGRRVAIKVLPFSIAGSVAVSRFRHELEVTARLRHPHIVPVLKAEKAGDLLYYVMPFAGDSTLRTLMDERRQFPLAEAVRLATEVSDALAYAHVHNVVHRDIKPENILIEEGRALVADFGIARAIERLAGATSVTTTGLTLGTPRYMSPEQAAASRQLDGRSDLYSLGCVVFEMLAGEPPFVSTDARTLVAKHINEPPPSVLTARPDLPDHVDVALRRALAKSPADRFDTADAFAAALRDPGPVASVQRPGRAAQPIRARRTAWAAGVVGVTAAATVAALLARRTEAPEERGSMRVAVMAFEVAEPDSALAVFGRAMTVDLIDALRRTPEFIPLTYEAIRAMRRDVPLDSLRDSLGVRRLVRGLLERRGDSVRVTARVVNVESLTDVGREPIRAQFEASELMLMRDTVIREVTRRLLAVFGREAQVQAWRASTGSVRAWELRQRAQDLIDRASELTDPRTGFAPQLAALARADSLLVAASKEDPSWTDPYVARGWLWSRRAMYEGVSRAPADFMAAESLANVALRYSADDAAALELRGAVRFARWRAMPEATMALRDSAEADLRAALRIDRDRTRALQSLTSVLIARGDTVEVPTLARRAYESDPYSRNLAGTLRGAVDRHLYQRRPDSARTICTRARSLFPDDPLVRMCTLNLLGWAGVGPRDLARAREELAWHERSGPVPLTAGMYVVGRFWIAAIQARSRAPDSARATLSAIRGRLREAGFADTALVNEAQVLVELGEYDASISLLERYLAANPQHREYVTAHPWFDALRGEPRFRALLRAR